MVLRQGFATPYTLSGQRPRHSYPADNKLKLKGESRKQKQRSLVATLCRDDKHTIIFALYSLPCYLYSVICTLLSVLCTLLSPLPAL